MASLLNDKAALICARGLADDDRLGIASSFLDCGTMLLDFGIDAPGGLAAGLLLAEVAMADLGTVTLAPGCDGRPAVIVHTDAPRLACLASQYAGWKIAGEKYFAMGSGPMRAAAAREPLFDELEYRESPERCVGVLETGSLPDDDICRELADKCGISADRLSLLIAPTRSLAGTIQIVARSVETAMHKLHELRFDVRRVASGWGSAPLPPPAADDMAAIGRTNDAILYGAHTVLYVRGDDASLEDLGPHIPSDSSRDYGQPFAQVMAGYDYDFYDIDPLLFSPAKITLCNLDTGNSFSFGKFNEEVLEQSFG